MHAMADEPVEMDQCGVCFGEVHPDATGCMHCGTRFEPWHRRPLGQVAIVVALAAVVIGGVIGANRAVDRSEDKAEECVETVMAGGDC
jgi:hypothetical protein